MLCDVPKSIAAHWCREISPACSLLGIRSIFLWQVSRKKVSHLSALWIILAVFVEYHEAIFFSSVQCNCPAQNACCPCGNAQQISNCLCFAHREMSVLYCILSNTSPNSLQLASHEENIFFGRLSLRKHFSSHCRVFGVFIFCPHMKADAGTRL